MGAEVSGDLARVVGTGDHSGLGEPARGIEEAGDVGEGLRGQGALHRTLRGSRVGAHGVLRGP